MFGMIRIKNIVLGFAKFKANQILVNKLSHWFLVTAKQLYNNSFDQLSIFASTITSFLHFQLKYLLYSYFN